jgi:hypothetical protein
MNESTSILDGLFFSLASQLGMPGDAHVLRRLYFAVEEGDQPQVAFDGVSSHRLHLLFAGFTEIRSVLDDAVERTGRLRRSVKKLYLKQHAQPRHGNQYNNYQAMEKAMSTTRGSSVAPNPSQSK